MSDTIWWTWVSSVCTGNNVSRNEFQNKLLLCNDQRSDMYVFIGEPKSCSHFITNGAKLRLSYKYIHIPSLVMVLGNVPSQISQRVHILQKKFVIQLYLLSFLVACTSIVPNMYILYLCIGNDSTVLIHYFLVKPTIIRRIHKLYSIGYRNGNIL